MSASHVSYSAASQRFCFFFHWPFASLCTGTMPYNFIYLNLWCNGHFILQRGCASVCLYTFLTSLCNPAESPRSVHAVQTSHLSLTYPWTAALGNYCSTPIYCSPLFPSVSLLSGLPRDIVQKFVPALLYYTSYPTRHSIKKNYFPPAIFSSLPSQVSSDYRYHIGIRQLLGWISLFWFIFEGEECTYAATDWLCDFRQVT